MSTDNKLERLMLIIYSDGFANLEDEGGVMLDYFQDRFPSYFIYHDSTLNSTVDKYYEIISCEESTKVMYICRDNCGLLLSLLFEHPQLSRIIFMSLIEEEPFSYYQWAALTKGFSITRTYNDIHDDICTHLTSEMIYEKSPSKKILNESENLN
jgi:hypothetical protein